MDTNVNNSPDRNRSENFVNPHFDLIRLWIQENIGKFLVFLLILTYLATGFFIGLALQQGLMIFGLVISWVASMSVAIVGQMIRGSLVYFSQANPYRLGGNAHVVGGSAALLLTVYACYEVAHLLGAIGVSPAFQTSIVGVIIGGFFVEVFFLNELIRINQATIVNDPELYRMAVENEEKLAEVQIKAMEAKVKLTQARRSRLRMALNTDRSTTSQAPASPPPADTSQMEQDTPSLSTSFLSRVFSHKVMNAIAAADNITERQMDQIRQWVDEGMSEAQLVKNIEGMSEQNGQKRVERAHAKAHNVPLDFSQSDAEDRPHPFQDLLRNSEINSNGNGKH